MDIKQAEYICEQAKEVRELFYKDDGFDGCNCEKVDNYEYNQYLSDSKQIMEAIEKAIESQGYKLLISPTGSGKTNAIISVAKKVLSNVQPGERRIILSFPTRVITEQVEALGVYKLLGGESFYDKNQFLIGCTYEKMFDIKRFIEENPGRYTLVIDEAHNLLHQYSFRNQSVSMLIELIEKNYFDSVVLISATPLSLSCFHYDQILNFTTKIFKPNIKKIEVVSADDCEQYIQGIDFKKEYPLARINDIKAIQRLISDLNREIVEISSETKESKQYRDIVENASINVSGTTEGLFTTSVLDQGASITNYPPNTVPMAVFKSAEQFSLDSVEQFFNRLRNGAEVARIIIPKRKMGDYVSIKLLKHNHEIIEFENCRYDSQNGIAWLIDVEKMDYLEDGDNYRMCIDVNGLKNERNFSITSQGESDWKTYSKERPNFICFDHVGFQSFIDILKFNYKKVNDLKKELQELIAMFQARGMNRFTIDGADTLQSIVSGAISSLGELSESLSFDRDKLVVDKRDIFQVSYKKYEKQFFYFPELLCEELNRRMGAEVVLKEVDTIKVNIKRQSNPENIWEGIEDIRDGVIFYCSSSYYDYIMEKEDKKNLGYFNIAKSRWTAMAFRREDHLMRLIKKMEKNGIKGEISLRILINSKSEKKINEFIAIFNDISWNQMLEKQTVTEAKDINWVGKLREKELKASVYYYLKKKGVGKPTLNKQLCMEISDYHKEQFPDYRKSLTVRGINKEIHNMYKTRTEKTGERILGLRLSYDDIFNLVEADKFN